MSETFLLLSYKPKINLISKQTDVILKFNHTNEKIILEYIKIALYIIKNNIHFHIVKKLLLGKYTLHEPNNSLISLSNITSHLQIIKTKNPILYKKTLIKQNVNDETQNINLKSIILLLNNLPNNFIIHKIYNRILYCSDK